MILVDTTVWIDFFRGTETPQVSALEKFLADGEDICICGIVLTEVLQGVRDDAEYEKTRSQFGAFLFLPMHPGTYVSAAELYRTLRRKGVTIRKPLDCMIAAVAIEQDVPLLHHDRDFDLIQRHCRLKVV